jgi:hypothetical protein
MPNCIGVHYHASSMPGFRPRGMNRALTRRNTAFAELHRRGDRAGGTKL